MTGKVVKPTGQIAGSMYCYYHNTSASVCLLALCNLSSPTLSLLFSYSVSDKHLTITHTNTQQLQPRQTHIHTLLEAQRSLRKGSEKLMFHVCSHTRSYTHLFIVFTLNDTHCFSPSQTNAHIYTFYIYSFTMLTVLVFTVHHKYSSINKHPVIMYLLRLFSLQMGYDRV